MASNSFLQSSLKDAVDDLKFLPHNGIMDPSWRNGFPHSSNVDCVSDSGDNEKDSPPFIKDSPMKGWTSDALYKHLDKFSPYDKSERMVAFPPRHVMSMRKRTNKCDCGCEVEIVFLHFFNTVLETEKAMMESTLEDQNYRISVLERQIKELKRESRSLRADSTQREYMYPRYATDRKADQEREAMKNKISNLQRDCEHLLQVNLEMERELKSLRKPMDSRVKRDCQASYDSFTATNPNASPIQSSPESSGPNVSCLLHERNVSDHNNFSAYGSYPNWGSVWTCSQDDSGVQSDVGLSRSEGRTSVL